ncbi:MAG: ABC transporter ATP-binding protein [Planctomycetes bacterium]|nr:ABC transporter ATP-binding protein [Planctomycetota bacterium]
MLELRNAVRHYHQGTRIVEAVRGVSLTVEKGEFVSIMGPSGSGKSTIMHLMAGLDSPTSGQALFMGRDLASMRDRERAILRRTRLAVVFQFFNLVPTLLASDNVALPLLLGGTPRPVARRKAGEALARVGLADRAGHYPDEMSGGEMQRVAMARALVLDAEAILCDEPTGNLDSASSAQVLDLLRSLADDGSRAVVMVTHDAAAGARGDRLVRIRDGRIESIEHPSRA